MTVTTAKWTLEEYHRMIDAGILDARQVELLNGEIIEMPPEGIPHAGLSSDAADYLRELLGSRVKIREGKPITLPNKSEPEPDIAVVKPLGNVYKTQRHPHVDDIFWVIEYSNSSLQKDLEVKSKVYAEVGIAEYWVINLRNLELIVFREPANEEYQSQVTLTQGDIRPLAFQDTAVSVRRLLT